MPTTGCLLLVATLVATPFEDTQGRFTIDLPRAWAFAPQPGDVSGASFQRKLNEVPVSFTVKVIDVGARTTLDDFVDRLTAGVAGEKGYQLIEQSPARLAGLTTVRRRYTVDVGGGKKWVKTAEDHYGVTGGKGYVVHMESLAANFPSFEDDFAHLMKSLRFKGIDANAPNPFPPELIGKWVMVVSPDTVMELKQDGTMDLVGNPGVWRIQGKQMMTRPLGGGAEVFDWRLVEGQLELNNANLGGPIRYGRPGAPSTTPPKTVIGRWVAKKHDLQLQSGGKATLDGKSGTYQETGGLLIFKLGKKKKRLVVEYQLDVDRLTLSEEQFGKGVVFERK